MANKRIIEQEITPEMVQLLKASGSNDINVARAAQREIAVALQLPMRQGVLDGPIMSNVFTQINFEPGQIIEFPLDFIVPGTESEYVAFTMPNYGRIPEKHIEGDYVTIPTYDVGAALDWALKYARDSRWDIVTRALAVLEAMFAVKANSDSLKTMIAAGVDRNVVVFDDQAPASFFTKRLISLMKTQMIRSGGGNLSSLNRITLTDVFMSPENIEDVRSWDLTQLDDVTRREVWLGSQDGGIARIFGVNLHELTELGVGQSGQAYFTSLGGSLAANGDTELVVGVDLTDRLGSSFVNPVRQKLELFEDEALHRQRRQGYYGWLEHGFGILDSRRVIFGSD